MRGRRPRGGGPRVESDEADVSALELFGSAAFKGAKRYYDMGRTTGRSQEHGSAGFIP